MTPVTLTLEIAPGTTFGPVLITISDAAGSPVPLAGWSAHAQARHDSRAALALDLRPTILPGDAVGLVTLPAIPWAATATLPPMSGSWDLVLQDPAGNRLPPVIGGAFFISPIITQPNTP